MATLHSPAELLAIQLEQLGCDFICSTSLPDTSASVRFLGRFLGGIVVWDMTLTTLASYRQALNDHAAAPCPFIAIQQGSDGVYPITVGLDLSVIDESVIKKSIIMVRNYKRLAMGKIEFCPPAT